MCSALGSTIANPAGPDTLIAEPLSDSTDSKIFSTVGKYLFSISFDKNAPGSVFAK